MNITLIHITARSSLMARVVAKACTVSAGALLLTSCTFPGQSPNNYSNPFEQMFGQQKMPRFIQSEIKVSVFGSPEDASYTDRAYIKMNNYSTLNSDLYEMYVSRSIAGMGVFQQISGSTPSARINAEPDDVVKIGKKYWYQRRDPLGTHELQSRFANESVLVLETTLREETPPGSGGAHFGHNYSVAVNIMELKTGKTLFFAEMQGQTFGSVKPTVVDPVLREAQQWLREVVSIRPMG